MAEFFQERLKLHQKNMQRYLKYVFNDHFALIMMFLVGGLGLYYSNLLKTTTISLPVGGTIVLIIWFLALYIGQFTSLAKSADIVFLLPKERQIRAYLSQAFKYSCYFPFTMLALVLGITMPLLVVVTSQGFSTYFYYLLMLWSLKFSHLQIQRMALFQDMDKAKTNASLLWQIITMGALALSIFMYPIIGLVLAVLQIFLFHNLCWQKMHAPLDWERMVQKEQHRLHQVYRFINLFTDVPEITAQIKRRKYLDVILAKITFSKEHTYLYLYARRLLRGTEFSGLYLRLAVLGSVLLVFVSERWFALGIGALFIYLIGFQLLPLYHQFQYMVSAQLYPIPEKQKLQAMKQLLGGLLGMTAIIFTIVSCFALPTWEQRLIVGLGYFVVVGIFIFLYLPYRIKKSQSK